MYKGEERGTRQTDQYSNLYLEHRLIGENPESWRTESIREAPF
jgi:hypothetical protein